MIVSFIFTAGTLHEIEYGNPLKYRTSGQDWENRFETISPHGTILYVAVDDICRYLVATLK